MRLIIFILLILISLCANLTFAKEPDGLKKAKQIIPLQSTHSDVVRLFGEPKESTDPIYKEFILKDGKLVVYYSTGLCGEMKKEGWNVPALTVIRVRFELKNPEKPEKLKIDLTGFEVSEIYDVPNAFIYDSTELGISYFKSRKGKIGVVEFYPADKFKYLYCRDSPVSK